MGLKVMVYFKDAPPKTAGLQDEDGLHLAQISRRTPGSRRSPPKLEAEADQIDGGVAEGRGFEMGPSLPGPEVALEVGGRHLLGHAMLTIFQITIST